MQQNSWDPGALERLFCRNGLDVLFMVNAGLYGKPVTPRGAGQLTAPVNWLYQGWTTTAGAPCVTVTP